MTGTVRPTLVIDQPRLKNTLNFSFRLTKMAHIDFLTSLMTLISTLIIGFCLCFKLFHLDPLQNIYKGDLKELVQRYMLIFCLRWPSKSSKVNLEVSTTSWPAYFFDVLVPSWLEGMLLGYKAVVLERKQGIWESRTVGTLASCGDLPQRSPGLD